MINLKFMTDAVERTNGNEFRLLYVIANTISLKEEGRTKIYRDMLADKLNLTTKQISRLTNSLVEKELLKKDLVTEGGKTVCYYSLNTGDKNVPRVEQERGTKMSSGDKNVPRNDSKVDKNVPLNKNYKELISKRIYTKKNILGKVDTLKEEKESMFDWSEELDNIIFQVENATSTSHIQAIAHRYQLMQDKCPIPDGLQEKVKELSVMCGERMNVLQLKEFSSYC